MPLYKETKPEYNFYEESCLFILHLIWTRNSKEHIYYREDKVETKVIVLGYLNDKLTQNISERKTKFI